MRKDITALLLASLTLLLAAGFAQAVAAPHVVVSGYHITQGSATVGKDFTLSLTLTNTENDTCAQDVTTTLQAGSPFILRGVTAVHAGTVCGPNSTTVDIPMRIDPSGTGGFYQITVSNDYQTSLYAEYTTTSTINVFVNGTPQLAANVARSSPVDVYPGDTATVTVNVQNDGTFTARSVTASLSATPPVTVEWAGQNASLGSIATQQGRTTDFSVKIPKDAPAKDYNMTLHVRYLDEMMAQRTANLPLTFHVSRIAQFNTTTQQGALFANQNTRTVQVRVMNTGTDTAYHVRASLEPQFPFSTDGSTRYIDRLDPGQTATVSVTVNIDKNAVPGAYGLKMLFDFEDAQGKQLQDSANVTLAVSPKGFFRIVFIDYWFLWALAIVIAAVVVRRRRKKK